MDSDELKFVAKGAFLVFVSFVLAKVLAFAYKIEVGRFFGAEQYGFFLIALAFAEFGNAISLLGLDASINYFIPKHLAKKEYAGVKSVIFSGAKILILSSLGIMLVFLLFSQAAATFVFHESRIGALILILSVSIPFTVLTNALFAFFPAVRKVNYRVFAIIALNLFRLLGVALFFFLGFDAFGIAYAYLASVIFGFFISLFYFLKIYNGRDFHNVKASKFEHSEKAILKYSIPLVFGSIAVVFVSWTATVLLGFLKQATDVGLYNAALPLAEMLYLIPASFGLLFGPVFISYFSKGNIAASRKFYATVFKWTIFLEIPAFLGLFFFSREILLLFFGTGFVESALALSILSIGGFTAVFGLSNYVLLAVKKTKIIAFAVVLSSVINVALNVFLIPQYGLLGAAIATVASLAFGNLFDFFLAGFYTRFLPFSKTLLNAVFAGAISMALTLLVKALLGGGLFYLILEAVLFLAVYVVCLFVLKSFDNNDKEILRALERKAGFKIPFIRNII